MSLKEFETDEQRAEALVDWLKQNSNFILLLAVVIVGTIVGQNYYQSHKTGKTVNNIAALDVLAMEKGTEGNLSKAQLTEFLDKNNNQDHQALGVMTVAGELANRGEYQEAKALLTGLDTQKFDPSLKALVDFRLAKVLFELNEYDASLKVLDGMDSISFRGLAQALSGDIHLAKGDEKRAIASYEAALTSPNAPRDGVLLKLAQLAGSDAGEASADNTPVNAVEPETESKTDAVAS